MKKRTSLLNLSVIFGIVYHVLFIAGYLLHKPLLGGLFCPPETLEQLEPVYSVPVIVVMAVCGIGFTIFVLLMRNHTGRGLFVGAAVFSGCAFVIERWVNLIAPSSLLNELLAERGELGVVEYNVNRGAVLLIDNCLLPLFVAAIALMCCAFCVKERIQS